MLWEKLAIVKDCVIVQIVNLGGYTWAGRYGKEMLNFCVRVFYNAYVVAKYKLWSSMVWEKLAMVKDCVIVQIVKFYWGGGLHTDRGGIERR